MSDLDDTTAAALERQADTAPPATVGPQLFGRIIRALQDIRARLAGLERGPITPTLPAAPGPNRPIPAGAMYRIDGDPALYVGNDAPHARSSRYLPA